MLCTHSHNGTHEPDKGIEPLFPDYETGVLAIVLIRRGVGICTPGSVSQVNIYLSPLPVPHRPVIASELLAVAPTFLTLLLGLCLVDEPHGFSLGCPEVPRHFCRVNLSIQRVTNDTRWAGVSQPPPIMF